MADWLTYSNSGATRNQPLSSQLVDALSFLGDMGITANVFSGGQPHAGEGPRVGSTRHDAGMSGDITFMKDGRVLDWSNPQDNPIFQEIVRRSKARGITGFGAGPGYMSAGSMHIGFGAPAVWGAGGKSANAPDWLREAYGVAPQGTTTTMSSSGYNGGPLVDQYQTEQPQQRGIRGLLSDPERRAKLALVLNNMSLNPNQGINTLMQERLTEAADKREMNRTAQWLASQGRDDLAQAVMSGALDGKTAATIAMKPADKPNVIEVGGKLVDETGKVIYDPTNGAAPVLTPEQLTSLNTLRDDATTASAELGMMKDAWGNISTFYSNPGSVSDRGLVIAFAKILDPTSVVRESESAAIANSGSLSEGLRSMLLNTLSGGGNLPDNIRNEILSLSKGMYEAKIPGVQSRVDMLRETAKRAGLPEDLVFGGDFASPAQPPAVTRTTPPPTTPAPTTPAPATGGTGRTLTFDPVTGTLR